MIAPSLVLWKCCLIFNFPVPSELNLVTLCVFLLFYWRFCVLYCPLFSPLNLIKRTALRLKATNYICWDLLLIDVPAVLCSFEVKGTVQPKKKQRKFTQLQNVFFFCTRPQKTQNICPVLFLHTVTKCCMHYILSLFKSYYSFVWLYDFIRLRGRSHMDTTLRQRQWNGGKNTRH